MKLLLIHSYLQNFTYCLSTNTSGITTSTTKILLLLFLNLHYNQKATIPLLLLQYSLLSILFLFRTRNTTISIIKLTLFSPLAWRYHSFMLMRVDFRDRSNMKNMVTASLQTRGNMLRNSRCPPRSHILNVISVFRRIMVFSIKFTPWHKIEIPLVKFNFKNQQ